MLANRFSMKMVVFLVLVIAFGSLAATAEAQYRYYSRIYVSRPVYMPPAPVYAVPTPVMVAPPPVYYAPMPVYAAPRPVHVVRTTRYVVPRYRSYSYGFVSYRGGHGHHHYRRYSHYVPRHHGRSISIGFGFRR